MGGTPATHRRSRCASLATLPKVAFRPPPLTPAPPAERLRSMASRSRHRSAVVAGRASRAGSPSTVVRRSPWVASPRRRLNRRSPARARVALATGSLRAGKIWILLHGIILPPAAGASRSEVALAEKAGTPVASRPKRSIPSSVLVLERFALKLPERPHRRRYPAKRKADDDTT